MFKAEGTRQGSTGLLTQLESTPPVGTVELRNNHGPQQRAALMKRNTKYVGLDVHQ